jgi:hypothetical protein
VPILRKSVIVDTGFWNALFERRDRERFDIAQVKAGYIESLIVLIPWPILYETVNTRFLKNQNSALAFERLLK